MFYSKKGFLPGDLLFYHGKHGFVTKAINWLDGAPSHVGLYIKDGKTYQATSKGVHQTSVKDSVRKYTKLSVMRLDNAPKNMNPVVTHAQHLLSRPYDFSQIILLALLLLTKKTSIYTNYLARLITYVLGVSAKLLFYSIKHNSRRLTCSEFGYRSYLECKENINDQYTIKLNRKSVLIDASFGDQLKRIEQQEISSFEKDGVLDTFFRKTDETFTTTNFTRDDINSFVKRWNSRSAKYSAQERETEENLDTVNNLISDYFSSQTYKSKDNNISATEQLSAQEKIDLNTSIKDFVMMHGNLIQHTEQDGFVAPTESRFIDKSIRFSEYTLYRNQFVTPKDLFEALNLKMVYQFKKK